jgi:hypothetical protein
VAGTVALGLRWLYSAYASLRNKQVAKALVQSVQVGREFLQSTAEGEKLDAELKQLLQRHQEYAGVASAVRKLLDATCRSTVERSAYAPTLPARWLVCADGTETQKIIVDDPEPSIVSVDVREDSTNPDGRRLRWRAGRGINRVNIYNSHIDTREAQMMVVRVPGSCSNHAQVLWIGSSES